MNIKVVGSSSRGNGYLIESENKILILELGCDMTDYLEACNYDEGMAKVCGCLVSHRHGDHLAPRTASSLIRMGYKIYGPSLCASVCPGIKDVELNKINHIGPFKVQAFELEHATQCFGYLIDCPDGVRVVFVTDCRDVPLTFKNVNFFMVEANNDEDVIVDNMMGGGYQFSRYNDHMSLQKAEIFLRNNFSSACNGIMLIHLSSTNSNEKMFVDTIKESLGFQNVCAAHKGLTMNISQYEF